MIAILSDPEMQWEAPKGGSPVKAEEVSVGKEPGDLPKPATPITKSLKVVHKEELGGVKKSA